MSWPEKKKKPKQKQILPYRCFCYLRLSRVLQFWVFINFEMLWHKIVCCFLCGAFTTCNVCTHLSGLKCILLLTFDIIWICCRHSLIRPISLHSNARTINILNYYVDDGAHTCRLRALLFNSLVVVFVPLLSMRTLMMMMMLMLMSGFTHFENFEVSLGVFVAII